MTVPGPAAVSGSTQEYSERTVDSCGTSEIPVAIRRKQTFRGSFQLVPKNSSRLLFYNNMSIIYPQLYCVTFLNLQVFSYFYWNCDLQAIPYLNNFYFEFHRQTHNPSLNILWIYLNIRISFHF